MKDFDVIHLVAYPVNKKGEKLVPDPRGLMQLNACVRLIEAGVSHNVLTTNVLKPKSNDTQTPISNIYAGLLRKRLDRKGITGVNIFSEDGVLPSEEAESKGSKETGEEIAFTLAEAAKRGWNILCLGYDLHVPRIRNRFEHLSSGGDWQVRSTHEVYSDTEQFPNQFKRRFEQSPYARKTRLPFRFQEALKMWVLKIDPDNNIQRSISHALPNTLKQHISG